MITYAGYRTSLGAKRATLLFTVNMAIRCVIFGAANTATGGPVLFKPFRPGDGGLRDI
jgi:hypothetical protein